MSRLFEARISYSIIDLVLDDYVRSILGFISCALGGNANK